MEGCLTCKTRGGKIKSIFKYVHIAVIGKQWVQLLACLCVSQETGLSACHLLPSSVGPVGPQPHREASPSDTYSSAEPPPGPAALQRPVCMCLWCPAELSSPHHTRHSMQTALTRTHREAQRNGHKHTLSNTHFLYRSHWGCVCCLLLDLNACVCLSLSFFSSFLPGDHHCSALPSVLHAVELGAPYGCRHFHTVAKICQLEKKKVIWDVG